MSDASASVLNPRTLLPALTILLLGPVVMANYWPDGNGVDVVGYPLGRDFINVWAGPRVAFAHGLWVLSDLSAYNAAISAEFGRLLPIHGWSYPLFTLFVFWPLAQLPYFAALAIWTVGLFAIFARVTLSQIEPATRPLALLLLVLAPATLINGIGGQNGFLSAVLLIGGVLLLDRRPLLAGVLFGLLIYKPHLGIVLPFVLLALGAWRTIAAAAVTAVALLAVSLAAFGLEPWRAYFQEIGPYQIYLIERFRGFGPTMMVSVLSGARTFGFSQQAALAVQAAVAVPVVILAAWAVRQTAEPARRAFVVVSASVLATPYVFNYDLPALTAVILWQLCSREALTPGRAILLLLAWIAPLAAMYLNRWGLGVTPLVLMAVFALAVRDAAAGRRERSGLAFSRMPALSGASAATSR